MGRKKAGPNIIGVAVASGQTSHTRIDADGNTLSGAQYNMGGSYYDGHGSFAFVDEVIDGQNMVKIPAMYYRRAAITSGPHNGKQGWWVADGPAEGFVLHPSFMKGGNPISHFWIGKYQGVDDSGTKLGSFGGTTPLVNLNIGQFQSRAAARNVSGQSGWMMWSYYQLAVIQMLAMIETASTDSQASIGQGRVSQSSAANVNASDVAQATYRGVVGLWGNVRCFIDGLKTVSGTINLWSRTGAKTWVSTGLSRNINGLSTQTAMVGSSGVSHDFRDVFIPDGGASSGGAWPDQASFYASGDYIPEVGGFWTSGALAGLWYMSCGNGASYAGVATGSRLAKEP